jgi:hypothetical protein
METIFQDPMNDFCDKINLVDDIVKEVKSLSHDNDSSKKKNPGMKNKLNTIENVF